MQNIKIIGHHDTVTKIARPEFHNSSYLGTVRHAFKLHLSTEEIATIESTYRRSTWSEESFYTNFNKTNVPEHIVLKDEYYHAALEEANNRFKPDTLLTPVQYCDLRYYPWRLSTNVGAPYNVSSKWKEVVTDKFSKRLIYDARLTKRNLYNEFNVNNRFLIHRIKDGFTTDDFGTDLKYWNTAFARLHLVQTDEPDKVRLVFGAPTLLLQAEMPFIWPIQISLLSRKEESPMLWGYETLNGGWYKLRTWFATKHPRLLTFFTFDWSSFDLLARHSVIQDIHTSWRSWFTFENGYWPTVDYPVTTPDPKRLEHLWKWMCNAVLKTPLLLPNGDLIEFLHSCIFSGYLQTQLLDSHYNMIVILTVLGRMGFDIKKIALKVQGDDSIGGLLALIPKCRHAPFLLVFAHYAKLYFGSKLNATKSSILNSLEDAEVLKYSNLGGIPTRPEFALLAQLRFPERAQTLSALMARSIGIAYANCGAHYRVYAICENIYTHLKSLGITPDPKGIPELLTQVDAQQFDPLQVDLSRFPSYFDTLASLLGTPDKPISKHSWNTDVFIGTPK
jgi:hypothetical protein